MTGSVRVQSRSKTDLIDRIFEWSEGALCPHHVTPESTPPEETTLDYVFEHVESFVCREDVPQDELAEQEGQRGHSYQLPSLQRDNSLVEVCDGVPEKLNTTRINVKPMGEKGDLLDYCFEHVESYACGEAATGELDLTGNSGREGSSAKMRLKPGKMYSQSSAEMEDEVQLYYRPPQRRNFS
mmetsp:Transcript_29816/g.55936  ORF Transcript_29816/g.55936 Transcript_29816/m.55936 type:complete len:183 (+) Transcript_29816:176-724(+)